MSHYKQTNYYFDTLVAAAIYKIRNPWDMRQVIASITQPQMSPPMLCRQMRCDKFDQYDKRGLVLHKQVSISDGKPVAKKLSLLIINRQMQRTMPSFIGLCRTTF